MISEIWNPKTLRDWEFLCILRPLRSSQRTPKSKFLLNFRKMCPHDANIYFSCAKKLRTSEIFRFPNLIVRALVLAHYIKILKRCVQTRPQNMKTFHQKKSENSCESLRRSLPKELSTAETLGILPNTPHGKFLQNVSHMLSDVSNFANLKCAGESQHWRIERGVKRRNLTAWDRSRDVWSRQIILSWLSKTPQIGPKRLDFEVRQPIEGQRQNGIEATFRKSKIWAKRAQGKKVGAASILRVKSRGKTPWAAAQNVGRIGLEEQEFRQILRQEFPKPAVSKIFLKGSTKSCMRRTSVEILTIWNFVLNSSTCSAVDLLCCRGMWKVFLLFV